MRVGSAASAIAAVMIVSGAGLAAGQAPPPAGQAPGAQTPAPVQQPGAPAPPPPVVGVPSAPTLPPTPARVFSAPVGMLFNTVRPERVADFEKVIAYLQAALAKSTDPQVQAQARGWHMYKASEPGPNGTVLYVFVLDPTVPGVEYGLGPILAAAYPDTAQLQEIWRLYTSSVTSGGSLLNLTPIMPPLPESPTAAPTTAPAEPPRPLDANPNTPGR